MDIKNKILIAEDEKSISQAYGEFLGRRGYLIEYAYDGEEAIKKAEEVSPDLILLDIVMPKIDGISVLKKLKENETTKDIPVIILTNLESSKDAEEAKKIGSLDYLIKTNLSLDDLEKKIAESCNKD